MPRIDTKQRQGTKTKRKKKETNQIDLKHIKH